MKSILRPACTLAVASLLFTASLRAADAPPGLVSFGKFTKPTNGELVEINLTSDMIAMAMQLAGKGQPEFTEALNGLHSVSVNVVGLDDQNRDEVTSRMKSVRAQLDASGWQPVVKVQEKKEDVGIYLKTRGSEAIEGVVITVLEGRLPSGLNSEPLIELPVVFVVPKESKLKDSAQGTTWVRA